MNSSIEIFVSRLQQITTLLLRHGKQ